MSISYNQVKGPYLKMLKKLKAETYSFEEARQYRNLIRNLRNDTVSDEEMELLEDLYEWKRDE